MTTKKTKTAKQLATQLATLQPEEQMTLLGFAEGLSPAGQELALDMIRHLVAAEEQAAKVVADKPRAPRRTARVRAEEEKQRFIAFCKSNAIPSGAMEDYLSRVFAREGSQGIKLRWDWAWESEDRPVWDEPSLVTEITQWATQWVPLLEFDW